jgi:hypothetical protein
MPPAVALRMKALADALADAARSNQVSPSAVVAGLRSPTASPQAATSADELINDAVKRSVEWQERYLDGAFSPSGSRRSSVSSLDSASTDLTESEPDRAPASRETGEGPPFPLPDDATSDGVRKSIEVASVGSDEEVVCQGHRRKRRRLGRTMRREGNRSAASFERAIHVPREFNDLKATMKPRFKRRVYWHEELEPLGIRTVKWDGRSVHSVDSPRTATLIAGPATPLPFSPLPAFSSPCSREDQRAWTGMRGCRAWRAPWTKRTGRLAGLEGKRAIAEETTAA